MPLTRTVDNVRALAGAVVRQYVLASAANVGDLVYINAQDKVAPARANAAATARGLGVIVSIEGVLPGTSGAAGQEVGVVVMGIVSGFTGMDPALPVWVSSATAGVLTQTAPTGANTWSYIIGYPIRSDVLMIAPQQANPSSNS